MIWGGYNETLNCLVEVALAHVKIHIKPKFKPLGGYRAISVFLTLIKLSFWRVEVWQSFFNW